MTGIVLSASVRQNLLSLQSTSQLLATTQNDLATGNKVNSALDNPTNYFTAQSLNSRASDISSLLDSVGNGVQVLQAANTGITSLKSLLDSAKSIANQALQASAGYSTKSEFSATITGATANNLLGTTVPATAGTLTEGALTTVNLAATAGTAGSLTDAATFSAPLDVSGNTPATHGTATGATAYSALDLSSGSVGFSVDVDGAGSPTAVTLDNAAITAYNADSANSAAQIADPTALTETDFINLANYTMAQDGVTGVTASDSGGKIAFTSATSGGSSAVALSAITDTANAGSSGLVGATSTAGQAQVNAAVSFGVALDGSSSPTTVTISAATLAAYNGASANSAAQITDASSALTGSDVAKMINYQLGSNVASFDTTSNKMTFTSQTPGANSNVVISGEAATGGASNTTGIANATGTAGTAAPTAPSLSFTVGLDGATTPTTVTLSAAALTTYNADAANSANQITDASTALSGADVAKLINYQVGSNVASFASGKLTFTSTTTGAASNVTVSAVTAAGGATDTTGITAGNNTGAALNGGLTGQTLTIGATAGGTATNITFGTGAGQISTLNDLNTALAANNLMATMDTHGTLTISTTNNNSSSTIGDVGGTSTDTGNDFASSAGVQTGPVVDAASQETRSGLVSQFNQILDQIKTTAQDSSFNGVNLLNGDLLQLTFNETGTSTLNIQGNTDDPAGLGLSDLTSGTDFLDNAGTNKIISAINSASNTLDSQASTLGSNLSIVQIRQTFSNSMINVLQTGASNLTLADPNELAADSQALSTRQSIAVSALALANQSQQSVLQLLQG